MRHHQFWQKSREFETMRAAECFADYVSTTVGIFELQTWTQTLFGELWYILRVYSRKSGKPRVFNRFKSAASRSEAMKFYDRMTRDAAEQEERERAAKAAAVNPYKVGDLFYTTFGYDMTIVEFFQAVRVTKRAVFVREIGSRIVSGSAGYSGQCAPVRDAFLADSKEKMHTVMTRVRGERVVTYLSGLSECTENDSIYFNRQD